jgi:hypothetical protein
VLTIPKRLRLHTRFDRKLLGQLCSCAWACRQAQIRRLLGPDDVQSGSVAAIQTRGDCVSPVYLAATPLLRLCIRCTPRRCDTRMSLA